MRGPNLGIAPSATLTRGDAQVDKELVRSEEILELGKSRVDDKPLVAKPLPLGEVRKDFDKISQLVGDVVVPHLGCYPGVIL